MACKVQGGCSQPGERLRSWDKDRSGVRLALRKAPLRRGALRNNNQVTIASTKPAAAPKFGLFRFGKKKRIVKEPPRDDSKYVVPFAATTAVYTSIIALEVLNAADLVPLYGLGSTLNEQQSIAVALSYGFPAAAALLSLTQAAQGDRLNSPTYIRLSTSLFLYQAAGVTNALITGNYAALALAAAPALPVMAVTAALLKDVTRSGDNFLSARVDDLKKALNVAGYKTTLGKYLSANCWIALFSLGSFGFSPTSPTPSLLAEGPAQLFQRTQFGMGVFLYVPILFILAEYVEEGRSGASTSKNLFLGSGLYCLLVDYCSIVIPNIQAQTGAEPAEVADLIDPEKVLSFYSAVAIAGSQIVVCLWQGLLA